MSDILKEDNDEKIKEYLSKITCRGCYNHCVLSSPCCGRSQIFIKEAMEKFNEDQYKK